MYNMGYMPYTTNPHLPRLRMEAANLVLNDRWSTRQVARHTGFNQSTIVRWVNKAKHSTRNTIPTQSSRPFHHPKALSKDIVQTIIDYRLKHRRCAEVLHHLLLRDGYTVSLSSIKRTIKRCGFSRYDKKKKWHQYPPRPQPKKPGLLLELDTIWDGPHLRRMYVYALLDVCSRWAYALPAERANTLSSINFVSIASKIAPFQFQMIQTDHGSEFSKQFTKIIEHSGIKHRHSRVRRPTDNGHVERFNRTIQEECLNRIDRNFTSWKKYIPEYIHFYNTERPHMGLDFKTPLEVMRSY